MKKNTIIIAIFFLFGLPLFGGCVNLENNPVSIDSDSSILSGSPIGVKGSMSTIESGNNSRVVSNSESIFTSVPDYSHLYIPSEFSKDDKEVQKILLDLVEGGAGEVYSWFCGLDITGEPYRFIFPESNMPQQIYFYRPVPDNYKIGNFVVPTTRDGMEKMIGRFFTEDQTVQWINNIRCGSITENSDGTFSVFYDDRKKDGLSVFLEIDGKLYRHEGVSARSININYETVKVIHKTNDTIEFTYLGYDYNSDYINEPFYSYNAVGVIKLEDGVWKLPSFEEEFKRYLSVGEIHDILKEY